MVMYDVNFFLCIQTIVFNFEIKLNKILKYKLMMMHMFHSYDILGARMLWKPKEARIFKKFIEFYRSTSVIW
jgi:hypothetical protein